jgi:hypothetical protein
MRPQHVDRGSRGRWQRVIGGVLTSAFVLAVPALAGMFLDVDLFARAPIAVVTDQGDPALAPDSPVLLTNWEDTASHDQNTWANFTDAHGSQDNGYYDDRQAGRMVFGDQSDRRRGHHHDSGQWGRTDARRHGSRGGVLYGTGTSGNSTGTQTTSSGNSTQNSATGTGTQTSGTNTGNPSTGTQATTSTGNGTQTSNTSTGTQTSGTSTGTQTSNTSTGTQASGTSTGTQTTGKSYGNQTDGSRHRSQGKNNGNGYGSQGNGKGDNGYGNGKGNGYQNDPRRYRHTTTRRHRRTTTRRRTTHRITPSTTRPRTSDHRHRRDRFEGGW